MRLLRLSPVGKRIRKRELRLSPACRRPVGRAPLLVTHRPPVENELAKQRMQAQRPRLVVPDSDEAALLEVRQRDGRIPQSECRAELGSESLERRNCAEKFHHRGRLEPQDLLGEVAEERSALALERRERSALGVRRHRREHVRAELNGSRPPAGRVMEVSGDVGEIRADVEQKHLHFFGVKGKRRAVDPNGLPLTLEAFSRKRELLPGRTARGEARPAPDVTTLRGGVPIPIPRQARGHRRRRGRRRW